MTTTQTMTMTTSDLSVYLGTCSSSNTKESEEKKNVSAPTLQEASKKLLVEGDDMNSSSWNSLHITVLAPELATAWSNPMDLASFKLSESAVVTVEIVVPTGSPTTINLQPVHTAFLLAGLQGTSERKETDGTRVFTAQKSTRISQPSSAKAIALPKPKISSTTSTAVTISLDDDDDPNNMMIDEDDLLNDEGDLAPDMNGVVASINAADDDCGGRSACDDCTCGRAEQESGNAAAATKQPIQTSACGKCGLGDAFRCASCPYLGKPAFKAGEEHLVLDLQDDF